MADLLAGVVGLAFCVLIACAIGGLVYDGCTESIDKRACRQRGGTVVINHGSDWHCVGATPERGGQ